MADQNRRLTVAEVLADTRRTVTALKAQLLALEQERAWATSGRALSVLRTAAGRLPQPIRHAARRALRLLDSRPASPEPAAPLSIARQIPPAIEPEPAPERAPAMGAPMGFDAAFYLRENPDIAVAEVDPLVHYLCFGMAEGRHPNELAADRAAPAPDVTLLCDPYHDEFGAKGYDEAFRISVLTPTYNTEPRYLRELHRTLSNQKYGNWEWVVVDDGSTDPRTILTLRGLADADPRVRLSLSSSNQGISGASNLCLHHASGTYSALVDHDDLVSRDAFLLLYQDWQRDPTTDLFYTDECKLVGDKLEQFWPKPDWSPAYLENTMCLGHLSVYRTSFLRDLGGFRGDYDGTQDFDLALRASLAGPKVVHLPTFGYLWRVIAGSAASDIGAKHYAIERQGRAVLDYARHKDPLATVAPGWGLGYWRIDYPLPSPAPLLSYVIPTGGRDRRVRGHSVDLVLNCIASFEAKRFYPHREYIVVHNGDLSSEQTRALAAIDGVRLVHYDAVRFNLSEKLNLGVASARGDYLCLLNDDVEAITEQGGAALLSYLAANPQVGAIGPLCLYEDDTIQQNGIVLTSLGPAHAGAGKWASFGGDQLMLKCRRESFCIGGAVMVLRKADFDVLSGFDPALPLNYNDVDFCLRLRARGLTCIVDPYVSVYHFEGATKTGTSTVEQERLFLKHPGLSDPYFNRWFHQDRTDYKLNLERRNDLSPFGAWLDRCIADRAGRLIPGAQPKLSVCVSVFNQPARLLQEMYDSVLMQTYTNVEFVILDNGSTNPDTLTWLARVRGEGRAAFDRFETNAGIDGGNRRLLALMTGDFFVAMDSDDLLSVDALQIMGHAIGCHPGRKLFYSDEYKSNVDSSRFAPFYKPDFDPVLLMNCCYPAHLMAMEAAFLRDLGAYDDPRAAWCHDYDTLTRALAIGEEPVHVRELIYAWRINPGSTASATTAAKPETGRSQRFVLERFLAAHGRSKVLSVVPNTLETSSGMWQLCASEPVAGIRRLDANAVWGKGGLGVAGLVAAAEGAAWVAILLPTDPDSVLLDLSAPAWLDARVVAVGGIVVDLGGKVRWSGGLFLPQGRLLDPYAGTRFAEGGYHGQLWCQRCVDVLSPVDVLIRADALRHAAASATDADSLMTMLGLRAHESGDLLAVTPHHRAPPPPPPLPWLTLDRSGALLGHPALAGGSRWYDGRLETDPVYRMPGQA